MDIRYIKDGEAVQASVANRPIEDVEGLLANLQQLVQTSGIGSAVILYDAVVSTDCKVGTPVYYNTTSKLFEPGLAVLNGTGRLVAAESANVWGIVRAKTGVDVADILVAGADTVDISGVNGNLTTPGTYYLSGTTPGQLVLQRPAVSIPVLRFTGDRVFVSPVFPDMVEKHVHYRFSLVCQPAGGYTPPSYGNIHTINTPDASLPGWLPSGHSSFGGKAPTGAMFGYNLAAHPDLLNAWPPLPASEAYLEWDKGLDPAVGFTGVPQGQDGLCIIDRNGIWWLSNCYGDVPWPINYGGPGYSLSLSDPGGPECPRRLKMALNLFFSKPTFATETTVVTSLRSSNTRATFTCEDGTQASIGGLTLNLDLDPAITPNAEGYQVIKEVNGLAFKQGPVCEGIYSSSPAVSLNSPARRRLVADDVNTPWVYQGPVELAITQDMSRELDIQLVRVEGVQEQFYDDVMYLGFPAGKTTVARMKIHIPKVSGLTNPKLQLSLRLLASAAGAMPNVTITARRVPAAAALTALPLAASEFAVTFTSATTIASAYTYKDFLATAFAVADGDIVLFSVTRSASDGYAGEIGLLRATGLLNAG